MAILYYSFDANYQSCKTVQDKIAKIDVILDALFTTAMTSVQNGDTVEYTLDTGQSKIHKVFSTTASVVQAIKDYETLRTLYNQKLSSRVSRLVDSKSIPYYGNTN